VRRIWAHRCKRWRCSGWKQLPQTRLYGEMGLVSLLALHLRAPTRQGIFVKAACGKTARAEFERRTEASVFDRTRASSDPTKGCWEVDIPLPGSGFWGRYDRLHALPEAGSNGSQAIPAVGIIRNGRQEATGDQRGWTSSIHPRDFRIEAIRGTGVIESLSVISM
jgi:hypothetical protein